MKSMRKGFTLIELMIVIAIIAIIAAIAIPNLMRSRIQANETASAAALRTYVASQTTFQVGKQGRSVLNGVGTRRVDSGFVANYRMLYYAAPVAGSAAFPTTCPVDTSRQLALISQAYADAFVAAGTNEYFTAAKAGPATPSANSIPYNGYLFQEPRGITAVGTGSTADPAGWFNTSFALVAVPSNSSSTGNNAFYVGMDGMVQVQGIPGEQDGATTMGKVGLATTIPGTTGGAGLWTAF